MFRNKVLVRAGATSSSVPLPPFLFCQISLPATVPIPALDLEILCSRLSRRYRLACLPQAPADALLVYQRCQSHEAAAVVSEVTAAFPGSSVGEVEELACSGELVAKTVGCGLRSLMLDHGWRCLGENIYVYSTFSECEERTDLCALNVDVRLGRNDDFEFVVSPDAFRFATHKLPYYGNFLTAVCTILPTLQEGHVIGYSKILPTEQCLDKFMDLCSLKHGLDTRYNYHVAVKLSYGTSLKIQWLPSSLVLQGSGLQPALKSVRASKAMSSLRSFAKLLNAWSFFGQNQLEIKEQLLLNCTTTQPTWDKTESNLTSYTTETNNSKDQSFVTNFVATDPSFALEHADVDNSNKSSHLDAAASLSNSVSSSSASLPMQVTQVSENQERGHAANTSCQGGGGTARDYISGIPEVKKAIPDIEKDVLSTKVISKKPKDVVTKNKVTVTAETKIKAKEDLGKKELTSVTKQKIISKLSKYEISGKVRDDQNDELNRKIRKAKTEPVNKDFCNSMRTKAEAGITNDELIAKVIDHHRRGDLRLLTVADLKCFLGARKAKVGGTKEVLVQRVTGLLG